MPQPLGRQKEESLMSAKRILFISGSIGLGHVTRDLAIARELRRVRPNVDISWLAAAPADKVLADAGEDLLPESCELVDQNAIAEGLAQGARLNLIKYAFGAKRHWSKNIEVLDRVSGSGQFDLIVGDDTYEVILAFKKNPRRKKFPFVMIYDFVGFNPMANRLREKVGVYLWNIMWAKGYRRAPQYVDLSLFIGEQEDVPDERFGFMLPNKRDWARRRCKFVRYVFSFDPGEFNNIEEIRQRLGYTKAPLVLCSIGGTAIGKELLELCGRAYPMAKSEIPDLQMVLVCGPRLAPDSLDVPEGLDIRGYIPSLHEHMAACDLAIVQAGGSTTLELTALRRPFIYFPIEGHCEQEIQIANRLARHGAGFKMLRSDTTPSILAEVIVSKLGTEVSYPPIAVNGARVAAEEIDALLDDTAP
jgi:predicted glycosyltransferase